jgi:hypothetical protein
MDIEVTRDEYGEVTGLRIDGTPFESDDGIVWFVPKACLKEAATASLPGDIQIECCEHIDEGMIFLDTIPFLLRRVSGDKVSVEFQEMSRRKYWDSDVGLRKYMETKRDIVAERAREIADIQLVSYEDDGDYVFLTYSAEISGDKLGQVIDQADQLIAEIDGATDLEIGVPVPDVQAVGDEREFAMSVVIPLLRKLGFSNVRYNHGPKEFGRDILFSRLNEFGDIDFWGAQVKHGDVAGGAASDMDTIVGQADDAFKMQFFDVYTRKRQHISKLLIAISGKFTANAIEKICEKIESAAIRNNLVFLDGDRIASLAERLRSTPRQ